jgi:hypothetical protein
MAGACDWDSVVKKSMIAAAEKFAQRTAGLAHHAWVLWSALTMGVVIWNLSIELPQYATPLLKSIFFYTSWIGAAAVTVMPSLRSFLRGDLPTMRDYFVGYFTLTIVSAVLAKFGDVAIAWAKADPMSAIAIFVAVLLVLMVNSVATPWQRGRGCR